ncbi:hypothetical protein AVEN_257753-1 [Araneus ventricosus]|uniref:Uncharacterized protein n=1 Tax=Araneus ventricosus TaxID=182803 RepID=A0A4Y2X1D6_ARAVE|nr:hypothetical protein AVEN_257753-1 [Araneus ventricosus]
MDEHSEQAPAPQVPSRNPNYLRYLEWKEQSLSFAPERRIGLHASHPTVHSLQEIRNSLFVGWEQFPPKASRGPAILRSQDASLNHRV